MTELWTYNPDLELPDRDLSGFSVETADGAKIGTVDAASADVGDAYLVVDTGVWIFGKRRVIPARAVRQVNLEAEKVFIDLTEEQVKGAPDLDEELVEEWRADVDRRDALTAHYQPFIG